MSSRTPIYQPQLFILIFLTTLHSVTLSAQSTWQSSLVQVDPVSGQLSYTPEPTSGIRIPDFSRAGYKGGGVPLPNVPVRLSIDPVSGDNTAHIQNAIDSVSSLPLDANGLRGALLLNPGTYRVYGTLSITESGVVLRGAGRESDTLSNTRILGMGNTPADRIILRMGGLSDTRFEGMVPGTQTDIISPVVKVGDKKFRVADASPFTVGDNIIIYHPCTAEWLAAINGGGTASDAAWSVGSQPILFNTRIVKIKCDTIFTNSPVFNTLDNSLSQSYIYKYDREGLVEDIGLENLRIDIEYNLSNPLDGNIAKTAVKFTQAENAWVRACEFRYFWFAGVDMETVNYVTIEDCRALEPKGPTDGGRKYNFCVSKASQNVLFTNCVASEGRHHYVSNGTSTVAGIVFHRSASIDPFTSSEGHRRWSTGLLYDNLIDSGNNPGRVLGLYNRGSYGTGHGWASANSVAWNCDATRSSGSDGQILIQKPPTAQNFAIGCKGNVTGSGPFSNPAGYIEGSNLTDSLVPNSLYEAQLQHRNYLDSIDNLQSADKQSSCGPYTWIDSITYSESTNTPQFTLSDVNGCDSIVSLDLTIVSEDNSAAPHGLNTATGASAVQLSWEAIYGADLYQVKGRQVGTVPFGQFVTGNSSKTVGGLNACQDYEWKVRARCGTGGTITDFSLLDVFSAPCPPESSTRRVEDLSIELYPNPATETVYIVCSSLKMTEGSMVIYDLLGRRLYEDIIRMERGINHYGIDVSNLVSGVYILEVYDGEGMRTMKFMVSHQDVKD